jgi:large subunit ribosomal protein L29
MMKAAELRDLTMDEIQSRLHDAREELMNLRFQQATGELTDFNRLRETRRKIARLLTVLGERERQSKMEGEK